VSEIDFQNGFLCGMATRGMATNGFSYQRFIELNVSDGYRFLSVPTFADSATTHFDDLNDSAIIENMTFTGLTFSDESEVTLT
jgi:hypothetical protein